MSANLPCNPDQSSQCHLAPDGSSRSETAAQPRVIPQVIVVPSGGRQTVWWVIAVLLAIIATALVDRWDAIGLSRSAMAQQASAQAGLPPVGARGIYAFTGQLGAKEYGLFMMDVDSGTIWCYQMGRSRDGELQMQLVAARSWIFDRFLEEFNVAKPTPSEVQLMVRTQRNRAAGVGDAIIGAGGSEQLPAVTASEPAATPFAPVLPKEDNPK